MWSHTSNILNYIFQKKLTITFKRGTRITASSPVSIACIDEHNLIVASEAVFDKTDILLSVSSEHKIARNILILFLGPVLKDLNWNVHINRALTYG